MHMDVVECATTIGPSWDVSHASSTKPSESSMHVFEPIRGQVSGRNDANQIVREEQDSIVKNAGRIDSNNR